MTNKEKLRYSMLIQWSDEDNAYLVMLPEWQNEVQDIFAHGDTYEEAAMRGRECLEFLAKSGKEAGEKIPEPDVRISDKEAKEIDRKWDELLSSPESLAFHERMAKQLETDREAGRLIPGGFGGNGEFIDELETAMKALIGRVRQGVMICHQEHIALYINETLDKLIDDDISEEDRRIIEERLKIAEAIDASGSSLDDFLAAMGCTASSGNVFADLGLPDPEGHLRVAERFRMIDNNGDFATFYQGYKAGEEDTKDALLPYNEKQCTIEEDQSNV